MHGFEKQTPGKIKLRKDKEDDQAPDSKQNADTEGDVSIPAELSTSKVNSSASQICENSNPGTIDQQNLHAGYCFSSKEILIEEKISQSIQSFSKTQSGRVSGVKYS